MTYKHIPTWTCIDMNKRTNTLIYAEVNATANRQIFFLLNFVAKRLFFHSCRYMFHHDDYGSIVSLYHSWRYIHLMKTLKISILIFSFECFAEKRWKIVKISSCALTLVKLWKLCTNIIKGEHHIIWWCTRGKRKFRYNIHNIYFPMEPIVLVKLM